MTDDKPWSFDVGTWVADLLVNGLLKPFLRPFLSDDGGEWLDGFGDKLMDWIRKLLRPVQWVVDAAIELVQEAS